MGSNLGSKFVNTCQEPLFLHFSLLLGSGRSFYTINGVPQSQLLSGTVMLQMTGVFAEFERSVSV